MSNGLIQATSQGIAGTYKDGTIKVVITIEPTDAAEAFAILGTPGAPLVIGQLTQEAAQASLREQAASAGTSRQAVADANVGQAIIEANKEKGGELAKWAGILCGDQKFWEWIGYTESGCDGEKCWQYRCGCPEDARAFILNKCDIRSRKELDHNRQAGLTFREEIMKPFHAWREGQ